MQTSCPRCGKEVSEDFIFCPFCGYQKERDEKLSTFDTAKILLGSFFLSPISLYWFFKYYKNPLNKKIAYISLVITFTVFVLGIITAVFYIKSVNGYLVNYDL